MPMEFEKKYDDFFLFSKRTLYVLVVFGNSFGPKTYKSQKNRCHIDKNLKLHEYLKFMRSICVIITFEENNSDYQLPRLTSNRM